MKQQLELEPIRALLFDIDGTLAETDDLYVQRLARRLQPLSFLLPRQNPHYTARRMVMAAESPVNQAYALVDSLHLDEIVAAIGQALGWSMSANQRRSEPAAMIAGTRSLLERASKRYRLGVVTARGDALAETFLRSHGLELIFDTIVGARSVRRVKPHPAPVRQAAHDLGLEPSQCLMVGDTTVDILSGARAGAQTVGVLCGFGERGELMEAGATLILPSTADLREVLGL